MLIYKRKEKMTYFLGKEKHLTTQRKWISISIDEQETLINLDYFEKVLTVYTTNQATSKRIEKKIGEPTKEDFTEGKISSTTWKIPFQDREKAKKVLSLGSLITIHQSKANE